MKGSVSLKGVLRGHICRREEEEGVGYQVVRGNCCKKVVVQAGYRKEFDDRKREIYAQYMPSVRSITVFMWPENALGTAVNAYVLSTLVPVKRQTFLL